MRIESDKDIKTLLQGARTIAVVGISDKPQRASHQVAAYLLSVGYRVVGVNPQLSTVLGQPCYPSLVSIPKDVASSIDIVDVFRRPGELPGVVADAIAAQAACLWQQLGVVNESASAQAIGAGLGVVIDRCTKIEHARLIARD